jgi:hypothetical protein
MERAAFLISQSVCALIEAMGMQAENLRRHHGGESMGYTESAFEDLLLKWGIHHNAALNTLNG